MWRDVVSSSVQGTVAAVLVLACVVLWLAIGGHI